MLKVLGENYYLDLDKIESYLELFRFIKAGMPKELTM